MVAFGSGSKIVLFVLKWEPVHEDSQSSQRSGVSPLFPRNYWVPIMTSCHRYAIFRDTTCGLVASVLNYEVYEDGRVLFLGVVENGGWDFIGDVTKGSMEWWSPLGKRSAKDLVFIPLEHIPGANLSWGYDEIIKHLAATSFNPLAFSFRARLVSHIIASSLWVFLLRIPLAAKAFFRVLTGKDVSFVKVHPLSVHVENSDDGPF